MTLQALIAHLKNDVRLLEAWARRKPPARKPSVTKPPVKAKPAPKPAPKPTAKTITMYDSIEVQTVPPAPEAVAGYTGGKWPTYKQMVSTFPRAHHLSIAISAREDAQCLDIENGDATSSEAPAWVRKQHARGIKRPVVYASLSAMAGVLGKLARDNIKRSEVRVWCAHYSYKPHLCGPACGYALGTTADGTQWTDHALNRNLDQSLCKGDFFS